MCQLVVKLNLDTRQWTIEETGTFSNYIDVSFGFSANTKPITFNNLSFGIILQNGSDIVYHSTFPKAGVFYKSTDSDYIELFRIEDIVKNTQYDITLWAENDALKSQTKYILTTPNIFTFNDYEVV